MPAPSRAPVGRSSSSSSKSSGGGDKKKIIAAGVMLALAGLLLAYQFGLFESVTNPAPKLDPKVEAEHKVEADRQKAEVERIMKENNTEPAGD